MIRIMTDSMSDITQSEAAELGITVLPLTVRFGEEEYLDGVEIDCATYYARLEKVTELPKTSQVTPHAYAKAFDKALESGEDEVLCITGSSGLSGTYQSACIGRNTCRCPERVWVVDSLNASHGEAMLVHMALRNPNGLRTAAELAAWLDEARLHMHMTGMAETLKYLVMGGRVNAAVGAIGNTLRIRPMVTLTDGKMLSAGLCHGKAKINHWFIDHLKEAPIDLSWPIYFAGANCDDAVAELRLACEESGVELPEIRVNRQIGPVIGTHTGPGLISIGWKTL